MKKSYMNPEAEVIEFDLVDVITTSEISAEDNEREWTGESANDDEGWSGWF